MIKISLNHACGSQEAGSYCSTAIRTRGEERSEKTEVEFTNRRGRKSIFKNAKKLGIGREIKDLLYGQG